MGTLQKSLGANLSILGFRFTASSFNLENLQVGQVNQRRSSWCSTILESTHFGHLCFINILSHGGKLC